MSNTRTNTVSNILSTILRTTLLSTVVISNNAIADTYNITNNLTNNVTTNLTVYSNTITKIPKTVPQRIDLTQYKQCKHIIIEENVIGDSIGHGVRLANGLQGNTSVGIGIDRLIGTVRYIPKNTHGSKDCIYRVTYVSIGTNDYRYKYSTSKYNAKLVTLESAIQSTINPNRIVYLINSNSRVDITNGTRGVIEALQKGRQFIMLPEHSKEPDTIHYTQYGYKIIYTEYINNYLNSVDIKNR